MKKIQRQRQGASSQNGISLIETIIALGVLSVGALGSAAVFVQGVQSSNSSPGDLAATQKAQEAIESVFSARDSKILTWADIQNEDGDSGSDGGVFLDAEQDIKDAGADGLVNTDDDGAIEEVIYPGRDGLLNTPDDTVHTLAGFKRQIRIRDINVSLRSISVTVTYQSGPSQRSFTLTTYISNYA